jgi:heme oxygenase
MSLFDATRDLHHACEAHSVGQRMFRGEVTREEWSAWLSAFLVLHRAIDPALPHHMHRDGMLRADLSVLPMVPLSKAATRFAVNLRGTDTTGAAYVLHGAHRSGGRVLAPKLVKRGLPCGHVCYSDPEAVQAWIETARARDEARDQARATFDCLLAVMDEIAAEPEGKAE